MTIIKIVTDSTADLSQEMIDRYGISVLPLSIYMDGKVYLDRVDITPAEFMEKMKQTVDLPKSSQPSVGYFLETYKRLAEEADEIISIHVSGTLSGTVQTARLAAEQSKAKVTVVDSMFISKGLSYQVIEAAQMAEKGCKMQEILDRLQKIKENTKLFVILSTLENLVKGGRIGKGTGMVGSLLKIKPISALENGIYTQKKIARSYSQAIKYLIQTIRDETQGKVVKYMNLVHADGLDLAHQVKGKIQEIFGVKEIPIEETTPVIGTHTGSGALAFIYYAE